MSQHLVEYLKSGKELWFARNRKRSANTKDAYWRFANRYAKYMCEHHPDAGITFEILYLDDWVDYMEQSGLSQATIQVHIVGCLQVADFGVDHGFIPRTHVPSSKLVDLKPVRKSYGDTLEQDELFAMYETPVKRSEPVWNSSRSRSIILRDAALIAISDDLPRNELRDVLKLTPHDLNLEQNQLRLRGEWQSVTSETVQRLRDLMASLPDHHTALFTTYTGNLLTLADCQGMLINRARDNHVFMQNGITRFEALPIETRKLLREQRVKRFSELTAIRDSLAIRFLIWTACRPEEACQTRIDNVKWNLNAVEFEQTKSGNPQEMPIPDEFKPELRAYVDSLPRHTSYLFFSETADRMHRRNLHSVIRQHAIDCGITHVQVHPRMIRRTVARWMRNYGANDADLDLFLRHRPGNLNKTHYSPVFASHIRHVLNYHPIRHLACGNVQIQHAAAALMPD